MSKTFQYRNFIFEPVAQYNQKELSNNMCSNRIWEENKFSPFYVEGYNYEVFYETYVKKLKPRKSEIVDTFNIYDLENKLLVYEALPYTYGFAIFKKENMDKTLRQFAIKVDFNWSISCRLNPDIYSGTLFCSITLDSGKVPDLDQRLREELYISIKNSLANRRYVGKTELSVFPDCALYFQLKGT